MARVTDVVVNFTQPDKEQEDHLRAEYERLSRHIVIENGVGETEDEEDPPENGKSIGNWKPFYKVGEEVTYTSLDGLTFKRGKIVEPIMTGDRAYLVDLMGDSTDRVKFMESEILPMDEKRKKKYIKHMEKHGA
jgi:hypothetical protein